MFGLVYIRNEDNLVLAFRLSSDGTL